MKNSNLVSLRWYRAKQLYDAYRAVPSAQRTNERATKLIEAIFDYAYENVPRNRRTRSGQLIVTVDESLRISRRIEEFLMLDRKDPDSVMGWLHENMVRDAWMFPEDLRGFVRECLQNG